MINKVVLVGRLTKDPVVRETSNNTMVASFTVACDRPYTPKEGEKAKTDFISVVVWRKQAVNVKQYCKTGSLVGVEGSLQTRNYEDQNGIMRYVTEVLADRVTFLSSKSDGNFQTTELQESSTPVGDSTKEEDPFDNFDISSYSEDDCPNF